MIETIPLTEALQIMQRKDKSGDPFPFNISFRTLNRKSRIGGRLVSYEGVKLFVPRKGSKDPSIEGLKYRPTQEKNPNHHFNRTRNIEKPNGDISKIHIRLIDSINGKKVVY
jgi:hypothetical protein